MVDPGPPVSLGFPGYHSSWVRIIVFCKVGVGYLIIFSIQISCYPVRNTKIKAECCIKTSFACLPVCNVSTGLNQKHRTRPVLSIVFLKQASQNLRQLMLRLYHTFVSSSVASILIWLVNQIWHNRQQLTCQRRCHPHGTSRRTALVNKQLGVLTWPLSVACGTVNISCVLN